MPAQSPFPDEKNIKNYSYNSSRNTTGSALMSILSRSGSRNHFPDKDAVPAEKSGERTPYRRISSSTSLGT